MKAHRLARLAWSGLTLHKLRSMLSALGIVFGVAAVIAMLSVGEGARREILAEVGRLGISRVSVRAGELSAATEYDAERLQSPGLTLGDAQAIREVCPTVQSLAPLRESSVQLQQGARREEASMVATTPSYAKTEDLLLSQGRFLTDADVRDAKRVIVLGYELSQALFPYEQPIGERIRVGEEWFGIVGTLQARARAKRAAQLGGRDLNRSVFVPLSTVPEAHGRIDEIAIRIENAEAVSDSARLIDDVVRRRHRGAQDYQLVVPQELLAGYERTRFQFNVVVGAVAAISLLVGGIGIMNIMLANVTERIREVGIRRSLGASRSDVVQQFLSESILLTAVGGFAGILLGVAASFVVSSFAGWPTAVSPRAVVWAVFLAASTGVGFGFYPALKAAQQNPVEALRHE